MDSVRLSVNPAYPSRLHHRLALNQAGRGDGEGGRVAPVEPELSVLPCHICMSHQRGRYLLGTTFSFSSETTYCSVPLLRIIRFSPSVSGFLAGRPCRT